MITVLLIGLLLFDVLLLVMMIRSKQVGPTDLELLEEMTEIKDEIASVAKEVSHELDEASSKNKKYLAKVSQAASEVEHDIKGLDDVIKEHLTTSMDDLTKNIDIPLQSLEDKRREIEILLKKVNQEKQTLLRLLKRSEKWAKVFSQKVPAAQAIEDIEATKYQEVRRLLAQGVRTEKICTDIGVVSSEVDLIARMGDF